jgi:CHAT domain-containing protein
MAALPGVREEVDHIKHEFPGVFTLINEQATKDAVLNKLSEHAWFHFSGHGHSDRVNPSASCLFVAGTDKADKLTVLDISKKRVDGDLAFLAACRTSQSGLALVDETLHLAGAFQLAGYRHVIAAMWPIDDEIAVSISRSVYALVYPGNSSVEHCAAILQNAVRKVRDTYPDDPVSWASFVHMGP